MSSHQISPLPAYEGLSCPIDADEVFGPFISKSCRSFDFTLTFEHTILSILPSTIFLILAGSRVFHLHGSSLKLSPNYLGAFKAVKWPAQRFSKLSNLPFSQVTTSIFAALQLSLLVLWSRSPLHQVSASIPSASLSFVDALAVCHLSYIEQRRSVRPSTLLNIYLLATLFFDIVQARTLFLLKDFPTIAAVCAASIGIKVLLLIIEAQSKASILRYPYRTLSPEETAGILNRTLLWWINSLLVTGHQKLLTGDELPRLDSELASEHMREEMERAWDSRCQ